ncbi:MAG: LCP family protein [Anaerolineae bacterium]
MRTPQVATSPEPHNERINILVLGLDVPDGGAEPARADTIMVVSVDPTGGPVSLLSIPRDLWVPIGPYGENRINTAYFLGEVKDYPGGGPGLLRATVEQMFGIYIDYYVVGDFDGFRKLVDQLGGVTITVETDIYDPAYPDGNGGVKTISIPAGTYRMDGEMALEYARSRHTTSDFDRAQRQQRLLLAIRDEALKRESISSLLPKLPGFYQTLSETVETDLSLDELIDLAQIASVVDINNVQTAVIDQTMTSRYITDKGWDVLLPIPEKIQPVIERLFRLPTASNAEPVAYELDASPQVVAEQAKVLLVNGSGKHGLAEAAADYLRQQGFTIIGSSDLERGDYSTTVVVTYSEKPSTVAALCSALHLTSESIRQSSGSPNPEQADIKVIIGQDFELPAD